MSAQGRRSPEAAGDLDPFAIEGAIEAFVEGFCFTRSFTHPYLAERVVQLWVMRDAPRTSGDTRNEEWVGLDLDPVAFDRLASARAQGRFGVGAVLPWGATDEALRAGFKARDYRLIATEPLMVHDLAALPALPSGPGAPIVERVMSREQADRLHQATRTRQVLPAHLVADAPLRQYLARDGDQVVGWVRSIRVGWRSWCSNLFVRPERRRQGVASALLARMLADDKADGTRAAVLLASHTGALLYPRLGYRPIGMLYLFKRHGRG